MGDSGNRISDQELVELKERGFTVIRGAIGREMLTAAQDALWEMFPRPDAFFANPENPDFVPYTQSQFAGLRFFPYSSWALNRILVAPALIDAAERYLGSRDIECYKAQLWAKYAGSINYDQNHHRDYGNHSLVVPRADLSHSQMTTFVLLSDVTEDDGPTKVVPLEHTKDLPIFPHKLPFGFLCDKEVSITGQAGDIFIYRTDVVHRGSDFGAPGRSRFVMPIDFQQRGWRWNGKLHWGDRATTPGFIESLSLMTLRERDLFGFPPVDSEYWNEQTLRDVGLRYPEMDMQPYAQALAAKASAR